MGSNSQPVKGHLGDETPGFGDWITGAPQRQNLNYAAQQEAGLSGQNTSGPFGGSSWTTNPDGTRTLSTSAGGLAGALGNLQQQATADSAHPMMTGDQAREQAINASYGQATSRLDPMFRQREDEERTRLANQGLDPNSAAATNQMGAFGRERNDAYSSAMNSAIGMGNEAQQQVFNQNMASRTAPYSMMSQLAQLLNPGMAGALQGAHGPQTLAAALGQGNLDLEKWKIQQGMYGDIAGGVGDLWKAGNDAGASAFGAITGMKR